MTSLVKVGLLFMVAAVLADAQESYRYPQVGPVDGPCGLRRDPGPCRGACSRYYYDSRRGSCRRFTYGCCGGNANNFQSRQLCESVCRRNRPCPAIACLVAACQFDTCPNFPGATCFAPCPCQAVWIANGEDVTRRCHN